MAMRYHATSALQFLVPVFAVAFSFTGGSAYAVAQSTPVVQLAAVHPHAAHIAEASQRFGIPEPWIRAVLRAESAGDVRAISSAGAMGLMQVMPDTGRACASVMASAAIPISRATTSSQAPPICARCGIATAMSRRCSPPTMPVPVAMTSIARRVEPCPPKPVPMSPRSRRSSAARRHRAIRRSAQNRRPIGVMRRSSSCVRPTCAPQSRRRPNSGPATVASPFRVAIPPMRSRRTAACLSPALATETGHEHGGPVLGSVRSGVQSGRRSPGCIPGWKGRKVRKGGGQDKGTWHHVAHVLEIVVVCALVRCAASGTLFLDGASLILRKALALLGFNRHHGRRTPDFPRSRPVVQS